MGGCSVETNKIINSQENQEYPNRPEISVELADFKTKKPLNYSDENCRFLLTLTMKEIGQIYEVEMDAFDGLLMPEQDYAGPIKFLNSAIMITPPMAEGVINQDNVPLQLVFWGEKDKATMLDGYVFGMPYFEELNGIDAFEKNSEAGERIPIKKVEIKRDNLVYVLYFNNDMTTDNLTLACICVRLES